MKEILVKPARCMGCRQCTFACAVEHSIARDPLQAINEDPSPSSRIDVRVGRFPGTAMPVKCRHCDPAPCASACPSGAITRVEALGLVMFDAGRCTECRSCAKACPFDAVAHRTVRTAQGLRVVALKCDGCAGRVEAGLVPACAEACKSGALVYEDRKVVRRSPPARPSRPRDVVVAAAMSARPGEALVHPEQVAEAEQGESQGGDR